MAGIRRAVDGDAAASLAVIDAQPPDPADELRDGQRPVARRYGGAEVDQRVAARAPLAVPRPAPPDGELDLDHRLEPVHVRALEEPDLDQSHGSRRITLRSARERRVSARPA